MTEKETIELLVEGGKASPGPATAPRFSAYKLNVGEIFKQVNEKTEMYKGMQVPVKVIIDKKTKAVEIAVGTPPVSSLIKKELGVELAKISEEDKAKGKTTVGNLSMEQVVKIAKMKQNDLLAKDIKSAVKQVIGTANSMTGVMVENKKPKDVIKEVEEGKYNNILV